MKRRMLSGSCRRRNGLNGRNQPRQWPTIEAPGGILFAMPDGSVRNVMMPGKGPQVRKAGKSGVDKLRSVPENGIAPTSAPASGKINGALNSHEKSRLISVHAANRRPWVGARLQREIGGG